ncbi:MAG: DNA-directed RNA polymerase subunit beta, partial [Verrucomicrobiota bacterium]|nr:DNA-directed RNA polymerase subunit beta [Verrucomicrobiota bacterium]
MAANTRDRINFSKIKEVINFPNLIDIQQKSYVQFLQLETDKPKRIDDGLQAVFKEVFPIESYDGNITLDFHSYEIRPPKQTWLDALDDGGTYGAALYVTFHLKEGKQVKEEEVFMGEIPLMTPSGSFVINGAERVIVSQLHRSPGLAFEASTHANGKTLHSFRIIPDRGSWFEAQFDTNDLLYVYLDRKKRRRKFLITTFFRALGFLNDDGFKGTDQEILEMFYDIQETTLKKAEKHDDLANLVLVNDVEDEEKNVKREQKYVMGGRGELLKR